MNHSLITAYPGLKSVAPRYRQGEEGSCAAMGWRNPPHPTADPLQPPSFALARGAGAPEPQDSCAEEVTGGWMRRLAPSVPGPWHQLPGEGLGDELASAV